MRNPESNSSKDKVNTTPAYITAIAAISAALEGLSNKDTRQALIAVSAMHNLRVISMDRPIVPQTPAIATARGIVIPGENPRKVKVPPPEKAGWKRHPEYLDWLQKHNTAVQKVKSADAESAEARINELKQLEVLGKELKDRLRGNSEVSSLSRGDAKELFKTTPAIAGESGKEKTGNPEQ